MRLLSTHHAADFVDQMSALLKGSLTVDGSNLFHPTLVGDLWLEYCGIGRSPVVRWAGADGSRGRAGVSLVVAFRLAILRRYRERCQRTEWSR